MRAKMLFFGHDDRENRDGLLSSFWKLEANQKRVRKMTRKEDTVHRERSRVKIPGIPNADSLD